MSLGIVSGMELRKDPDNIALMSSRTTIKLDLWPLDEIDTDKAKFPCCLVWTPLPVISWLAPFIGHVGICREDGAIIDFTGSNFINVDDFAFGAAARYVQLDRSQCCFPMHQADHTYKQSYQHSEFGTSINWDDALRSSVRNYEHKNYNIFICNCHSFAANCLNRLSYGGSMNWNMVNVAVLIFLKGRWVNFMSVIKSFLPFTVVVSFGLFLVGWPFVFTLLSFSFMLLVWYLMGTYCFKCLLLDC